MNESTTTFLVKIVRTYNADAYSEQEAQERWLELLDPWLQEHAEIIAGLVDKDGVPVQPSAKKALAALQNLGLPAPPP